MKSVSVSIWRRISGKFLNRVRQRSINNLSCFLNPFLDYRFEFPVFVGVRELPYNSRKMKAERKKRGKSDYPQEVLVQIVLNVRGTRILINYRD